MKNAGTLQFILNGNPVVIDFHGSSEFAPTTTLLQYLRKNPALTGTKEGCAEGDCGACTVVVVTYDHEQNKLVKAVDSCLIFLPMLQGKAVITVEHLAHTALHPVQAAMVDHDGSQCGYCTPGFVMSMYALHQNHNQPSKEVITDALTGNLCRCTGYRSILEAAEQSINGSNDHGAINTYLEELSKLPSAGSLSIVQGNQKYFQPINLDEALELRSMYPKAVLINGATDIALKVTKNDELLENVIDLSQVGELQQLEQTNNAIILGAGLSLEQVKASSKDDFSALYDCLAVFGSLQIRNLATLGGNIASASPIGDTIPVLMAYGATLTLANSQSRRSVAITDFITGYRKTCLAEDEILVNISIPKTTEQAQIKWYKISKRKDLDISSVSGGFYLKLNGEKVEQIKLYYGGMAAQTSLASATGEFLTNQPWSWEQVNKATSLLEKDFTPISDARANADSRMVMAKNLLLKLWTETNVEN